MTRLTHIDLFSGIGGFALAAQWAGFKTLAFVEIDLYAQEIIIQNFGAVADAARLQQGWQEQRTVRERVGECGEQGTLADADEFAGNGSLPQSNQRAMANGNGDEQALHDAGLRSREGSRGEIGGSEQSARWEPEPDVGRVAHGIPAELDRGKEFSSWEAEPQGVPRVATGVKNRVGRLKGLGNSIVPQVGFEIISAIAEIEARESIDQPALSGRMSRCT